MFYSPKGILIISERAIWVEVNRRTAVRFVCVCCVWMQMDAWPHYEPKDHTESVSQNNLNSGLYIDQRFVVG